MDPKQKQWIDPREFGAVPDEPEIPLPMTADQQIRARALAAAVDMFGQLPTEAKNNTSEKELENIFWGSVSKFEAYIRDSK